MRPVRAVDTLEDSSRPWYRCPWAWVVFSIPATAVVAGFITLWIAVRTFDGPVADDYYKRGLQINRQLARDQAAARLGLTALVRLDRGTSALTITVRSDAGYEPPARIQVELLHHTRAGFDRSFAVERDASGVYRSLAPPLAQGSWTIRLAAEDWRLQGVARFDDGVELRLEPVPD